MYAYWYPKQEIYPAVLFDDEKAAADVTCLLIDKGHRRIGVICGPASSYHTQARLKGYKTAPAEHGIKSKPGLIVCLIVYGDY